LEATASTHITIENTLVEKGLSKYGGGGKIKFYSDAQVATMLKFHQKDKHDTHHKLLLVD